MADLSLRDSRIAYFSMEVGLQTDIPTYSGGLGVLAGDTLKSGADLGLPMIAVSLLYRKGYFRQELSLDGWQKEHPVSMESRRFHGTFAQSRQSANRRARCVDSGVAISTSKAATGSILPVHFLDTDIAENHEWDRGLTHHLYGGDETYRCKQEVILGIGGVRMLEDLGYSVKKYHMNEGHAALADARTFASPQAGY